MIVVIIFNIISFVIVNIIIIIVVSITLLVFFHFIPKGKVLEVSETKLDDSFPTAQFSLNGLCKLYRLIVQMVEVSYYM